MKKHKPSGPAIFMYCVIAFTLITSIICFVCYYGHYTEKSVVLWTGITAFTIMYHFWVRIIMGNVSKLFKVHYKQKWFQERKFEKTLYNRLRVKNWKGKALTYNPQEFSLKERTLEQIVQTMTKSELDHWLNVGIALSTILFAIPWGEFWIFFLTAIFAVLFDGQFIVIQRYNRPRIVKILERQAQK